MKINPFHRLGNFLSRPNPRVLMLMTVIFLGGFFRLGGLNWDRGQHLHPDERFLTMVASSMQWPGSVAEYFDTGSSKLNPHNIGSSFYVYGTWPVILVKFMSTLVMKHDYVNLTLTGRLMSAICDLLVLILVYRMGILVSKGSKTSGIIAAFLYATMAVPIQMSHFFTVDPYGTLLMTYVLYQLLGNSLGVRLGLTLGLAVAAKISSVIIIPVVILAYIKQLFRTVPLGKVLLAGLVFSIVFLTTLRISYPYLFSDGSLLKLNQKVLKNWQDLKSFDQPGAMFPPVMQWDNTQPVIYPLVNMIVVGLGIPHALILAIAITAVFYYRRSVNLGAVMLLFTAFMIIFFYQGIQVAKPVRYFYVLYPIMAVISGVGLAQYMKRSKRTEILVSLMLAVCTVWPVAVTGIYLRPHSRIQASRWVYMVVPGGSVIAGEHWDDFLPLSVDTLTHERYKFIELPVFGIDNGQKWTEISDNLSQADYAIMSSNRAYGALTRLPARFPQTGSYYRKLLGGKLGFEIVAQFTSRPHLFLPVPPVCISLPYGSYGIITDKYRECRLAGISFVDDYMDETWTVYDHPKVLILRNVRRLSPEKIYQAITESGTD